jgi:hypothetical protein
MNSQSQQWKKTKIKVETGDLKIPANNKLFILHQ